LPAYTPDVLQEEFPNRLVPTGARRDLAALREAGERGRKILRGQRYEVRAAYAVGDTVILEVLWVGTLAVPVGAIPAGGEMRAHFAVFLEFRDGRIHRQRNYDCFEPF
jgi:ketosteroid isomerase-like protein